MSKFALAVLSVVLTIPAVSVGFGRGLFRHCHSASFGYPQFTYARPSATFAYGPQFTSPSVGQAQGFGISEGLMIADKLISIMERLRTPPSTPPIEVPNSRISALETRVGDIETDVKNVKRRLESLIKENPTLNPPKVDEKPANSVGTEDNGVVELRVTAVAPPGSGPSAQSDGTGVTMADLAALIAAMNNKMEDRFNSIEDRLSKLEKGGRQDPTGKTNSPAKQEQEKESQQAVKEAPK